MEFILVNIGIIKKLLDVDPTIHVYRGGNPLFL